MNIAGKRTKLVRDNRKIERKKKKIYDQDVLVALKKLWRICDYICSKRLAPFLKEITPVLEKWEKIKLSAKVREKLFKINAATIDRMFADTPEEIQNKGKVYHQTRNPIKKEYPH